MTPTPELRFVERTETTVVEVHEDYTIGSTVLKQVLQQKWVETDPREYNCGDGEWRDVPTVKEGA